MLRHLKQHYLRYSENTNLSNQINSIYNTVSVYFFEVLEKKKWQESQKNVWRNFRNTPLTMIPKQISTGNLR